MSDRLINPYCALVRHVNPHIAGDVVQYLVELDIVGNDDAITFLFIWRLGMGEGEGEDRQEGEGEDREEGEGKEESTGLI